MAFQPTEEQAAARDLFVAGNELAVIAGAGTGKTATLVLMAAGVRKKRGLYVAFNKAIAVDAGRRFGPHVDCRTAHSLAHTVNRRTHYARLNASAHSHEGDRRAARHPAGPVGQLPTDP